MLKIIATTIGFITIGAVMFVLGYEEGTTSTGTPTRHISELAID